MRVKELNPLLRILDFALVPFMWILSGFKFEKLQESHPWHVKKFSWKKTGILIKGDDMFSKFGQSGISKYLGLYHMPIFGGLKKYVVLENKDYKNYWNIGWDNHIQTLKIYDSKIRLLSGKEGYNAHALSDGEKESKITIKDSGTIGDGRYSDVRLF